jgi:hypothetical protein
MPTNRDLEGAFSWVTFFGQAKKVTRPPGMAGEAQQGRTPDQREASKAKSLGSRFRGNDETKPGMTKPSEEQNGFRPSPE